MMMQCQPQASQKFKTGQDFLEIFRPKIPQLAESYMKPLSLPAQNEGKRKGKNKNCCLVHLNAMGENKWLCFPSNTTWF